MMTAGNGRMERNTRTPRTCEVRGVLTVAVSDVSHRRVRLITEAGLSQFRGDQALIAHGHVIPPVMPCGFAQPRNSSRGNAPASTKSGADAAASAPLMIKLRDSEVPVLVLGGLGLADDVRRARATEEVVVLFKPGGPGISVLATRDLRGYGTTTDDYTRCVPWANCGHARDTRARVLAHCVHAR